MADKPKTQWWTIIQKHNPDMFFQVDKGAHDVALIALRKDAMPPKVRVMTIHDEQIPSPDELLDTQLGPKGVPVYIKKRL